MVKTKAIKPALIKVGNKSENKAANDNDNIAIWLGHHVGIVSEVGLEDFSEDGEDIMLDFGGCFEVRMAVTAIDSAKDYLKIDSDAGSILINDEGVKVTLG